MNRNQASNTRAAKAASKAAADSKSPVSKVVSRTLARVASKVAADSRSRASKASSLDKAANRVVSKSLVSANSSSRGILTPGFEPGFFVLLGHARTAMGEGLRPARFLARLYNKTGKSRIARP